MVPCSSEAIITGIGKVYITRRCEHPFGGGGPGAGTGTGQSERSGERWNVVIDCSPMTSSAATVAKSAGTMKPG